MQCVARKHHLSEYRAKFRARLSRQLSQTVCDGFDKPVSYKAQRRALCTAGFAVVCWLPYKLRRYIKLHIRLRQSEQSPFPKKEKLISVITSDLAVSRGHINRLKFVKKLKEHFGNQIDVFGHGFNEFEDKWDILSKYKYHICIENCSEPYYWTEKISDCFLAGCFPFYYGCKNFADYFPEESYLPIDICDFDKSIEIINKAIENNIFEKSQDFLQTSKDLVLDKYNMFEHIASICDKLNPNAPKTQVACLHE